MKRSQLTTKQATGYKRNFAILTLRDYHSKGRLGRRVLATILLLSMALAGPLGISSVYAFDPPQLISPANATTVTPIAETCSVPPCIVSPPLGIPELKWEAVTGATKYRVQIAKDIGFVSLIVDEPTLNTSFTPRDLERTTVQFTDGTWYWRVKVEAPAPYSAYSEIRSFVKQWASPNNHSTLLAPANGAVLDFYNEPAFSWTPVVGAAMYELQIYTTPGGWGDLEYGGITWSTSHQPLNKLPNGTYYWRVVPLDSGDPVYHDGTPSEERTFEADYNYIPQLLEPENLAEPTFTPTMRWTAVRGAQYYNLQYATDTNFSENLTTIKTRNTAYTPTATLPNDTNYYWRVQVVSGDSVTDWSEVRSFMKKWYIKPVLLTPTNTYQHQRFPVFSWTPVPGAAYYKVELSKYNGMSPLFDYGYTSNTWWTPTKYEGVSTTWYWRVFPYDGSDRVGHESDTKSYQSYYNQLAPQQVYPMYYYTPNSFLEDPAANINPYEDRTVALPIFKWHTVYEGQPSGAVYGTGYRLQVATNSAFIPTSIVWQVDTENIVAAPTQANPFNPLPDTNYYWRVRPLIGGSEVGQWSQAWKTQINTSLGLTPTIGTAPTLMRPNNGFESMETAPLLEWFPLEGATAYDIEISQSEDFSVLVDSASVDYPAYIPTNGLAQRRVGDVDFGIYYWRVRATGGEWSEVRRFQVSAQSQYRDIRSIGDGSNRLQIGSDPAGDIVNPDYDLTSLQVAQSPSSWYIGFHVPLAPIDNVSYVLYLDMDHLAGSGATHDALGNSITTISGYRPEYAIYLYRVGGQYTGCNAYIFNWVGGAWSDIVGVLGDDEDPACGGAGSGGDLDQVDDYLEMRITSTAIGHQSTSGSYAISLMSLPELGGSPLDSVPSDMNVPGSSVISRFSNVSERMNIIAPISYGGLDATAYASVQPFFWDWPILAPWSGALTRVYLDPLYTTVAASYTYQTNTTYWAETTQSSTNDIAGDNTYYWRIQPDYDPNPSRQVLGAWSQGYEFERRGFIPQNLQTSVSFATPTFSWDMVEGAESYDLQIDDDPNFGSPEIANPINTKSTSYTPLVTLADGVAYYWRVRVRRYDGIVNSWSVPADTCPIEGEGCFSLSLPVPTGLYQVPPGVVQQAPTLCWSPVIMNNGSGEPVLAAYKYAIQLSKDPGFSVYEYFQTEQNCWTRTIDPVSSLYDFVNGAYYWRVAMIDGDQNPKTGSYSPPETFTKQYPITTLVSPLNGASVYTTPTFIWTPVYGAAFYRIQVSEYENFTTLHESIDTVSTSYTPTLKVYTRNKTYYWRVAMMDNDLNLGPYNDATIIFSPYPYASFMPYIKK